MHAFTTPLIATGHYWGMLALAERDEQRAIARMLQILTGACIVAAFTLVWPSPHMQVVPATASPSDGSLSPHHRLPFCLAAT